MRLWHESLLTNLSRQRLLSQHRECCALRGKGWGKRHSTIDYVFRYPKEDLVAYHHKVMDEMLRRGYLVNRQWYMISYRGKQLTEYNDISMNKFKNALSRNCVYSEHNEEYLQECILLLISKNDIGYKVEWRNWQTPGT